MSTPMRDRPNVHARCRGALYWMNLRRTVLSIGLSRVLSLPMGGCGSQTMYLPVVASTFSTTPVRPLIHFSGSRKVTCVPGAMTYSTRGRTGDLVSGLQPRSLVRGAAAYSRG